MIAQLQLRRHTRAVTVLWVFLWPASVCALADIINVPADQPTIQDCIVAAMERDTCVVAPGTYVENVNFLGKALTLRSSRPDDPAVVAATIIDAGGQGSAVTCNNDEGPDTVLDGFTITGGVGTESANGDLQGGGMFVFNSSPTVTRCTFSSNTAEFGGGLYIAASSQAIVSDCVFNENSADEAGGALRSVESEPAVSNCTFANNDSVEGGAVDIFHGAPAIQDCLFSHNEAVEDGGGLHSDEAEAVVQGCSFTNNFAGCSGGGAAGRLNPIQNQLLTITDCTFASNRSVDDGGGLEVDNGILVVTGCDFADNVSIMGSGGGMYHDAFRPAQISDCDFTGNAAPAGLGGGAAIDALSAAIENCSFVDNESYHGAGIRLNGAGAMTGCLIEGNRAEDDGGGVYVSSEFVVLRRCVIRGNSALESSRGGGIYISTWRNMLIFDSLITGNFARWGGGIDTDGIAHLVHCTLSGNVATLEGSAIHIDGPGAETVITNCIVWGNEITGDATVSYSDVENGWVGEGNIDADPLFVEPGLWDDNGTPEIPEDDFWVPGDYHLLGGSPCIDASDNIGTTPIDCGDCNTPQETLGCSSSTCEAFVCSGDAYCCDIEWDWLCSQWGALVCCEESAPEGNTTDLDGLPRFQEDLDTQDSGNGNCPITDMGSYEFPSTCLADIDCDASVGIGDLLGLFALWGPCTDCAADIDGDGNVGMNDLLALIGYWGPCPT